MNINRFTLASAAMAAFFLSTPAMGETVKRGLVGCVSEELLDEAVTYATKRDNSGLMQLLTSGRCTILKEGEQVSVISQGFMTATVRYRGAKLYTPSEAVR